MPEQPQFSTRFVKWTGSFFHSEAPGPNSQAFTAIPPTTWIMCSPVRVK